MYGFRLQTPGFALCTVCFILREKNLIKKKQFFFFFVVVVFSSFNAVEMESDRICDYRSCVRVVYSVGVLLMHHMTS